MKMKIKAIRGVKDILPHEVKKWEFLETKAREIFESYGFAEIKIPIFEKTALFARGIGEATDIVEKEMYTFVDKGGEEITLRPEATASIVRAYIEHHLHASSSLVKLFCIGPMFRYERPQAGRLRQFHQINAEAFGSVNPALDAEIISMLDKYLERLEVKERNLLVNSLGCRECRPQFKETLTSFLKGKLDLLCDNCRSRFDRNPMRILDCKEKKCKESLKNAPKMREFICEECREHFEKVLELLSGLHITYTIEDNLVRGLDYYTRTAFEITAGGLGAQNSVAGGGRYDNLVEEIGGPPTPAIGFAIGMERLVSVLGENKGFMNNPKVFIASLGEKAEKEAFRIIDRLRSKGISAERDFESKSLKSQMRKADKLGAEYVVILGEDEIKKGKLPVKSMKDGSQEEITIEKIEDYFSNKP
jgi:histidyl-tRNA synthetase